MIGIGNMKTLAEYTFLVGKFCESDTSKYNFMDTSCHMVSSN
jgi:hypothetical protein